MIISLSLSLPLSLYIYIYTHTYNAPGTQAGARRRLHQTPAGSTWRWQLLQTPD